MHVKDYISISIDFIKEHNIVVLFMVFVLSFIESLSFLSIIFPATIILVGLGALIIKSGVFFWSFFFASVSGSFFSDWLSYWIGYHYKEQIYNMWPFNRYPLLLKRGYVFFKRYGLASTFFSRFIGPLRSVVPIIAGLCKMPLLKFQIANISSALIWSYGIFAPWIFGIQWLIHLFK